VKSSFLPSDSINRTVATTTTTSNNTNNSTQS
jgi:hypothetical protein